ncbi:MAG: hypothetical protein EFKGCFLK_01986 [Rhodocyclaceae bacterium]|nr:MAG: hypothetical protein F9K21_03445 [Rhodocyclaceae bacterium]MBV6408399.1 hypothetical protein [Rhodocyclaceae bacterium]CAG0929748.1 Cyclic-di-GMP receptor FimW [Rhodocyclaceae bacterium]
MSSSSPVRKTHPSDDVTHVLDWLASPISDDPAQDLAQLGGELAALRRARIEDAHFHRILDLFYDRAHRLARALRARLTEASLPLAKELRATASLLIAVHLNVVAGYEHALQDPARLALSKRRNAASVAARALRSLAAALDTCFMVASPPPTDLWHRAHALARSARAHFEPTATVIPGLSLDPENLYKGMLALAAAQPEGFSPVEVALASDYLAQFSAAVSLLASPPKEDEGSWYWVDGSRDMGPVPPNRRIPPDHGDLLFCSFQMLARLLSEQIAALENGMPAGNLRLPERAAGPGGIAALKRLQTHWAQPPHRQHARRHNNFRAEVCVGLSELWQLLESGEAPAGAESGAPRMTEWMVLNESPTGYAVMHVAGTVEGLVPGSVIALRPASDKPWNICVVRWMKSENPEHIELGLELVSPAARSVQLMFRNGDSAQQPTAGLLLPAIPALREHPALLAPSGAFSARRFFIVSGEDKTHVMQGRLLSMDLQTGAIELFQFESDPYPM